MATLKVGSIGEYIREQRKQAQISLRQLAEAAGVSNPYLSQIERGLRKPSAEILQQIATGLRISAEALYVQAGILEDHHADSGVRPAVLADPHLLERQKQILLEIYDSFRRENAATGMPPAAAPSTDEPEDEPVGSAPAGSKPRTDGRAADGRAANGRAAAARARAATRRRDNDTDENTTEGSAR
ncbi:MAG: helix-turn-helix domain-containing protein [Streptosporangiales bacterium]|nr:helix-turn-helix domain-containing protein [Streptosporangiales bacterium]